MITELITMFKTNADGESKCIDRYPGTQEQIPTPVTKG